MHNCIVHISEPNFEFILTDYSWRMKRYWLTAWVSTGHWMISGLNPFMYLPWTVDLPNALSPFIHTQKTSTSWIRCVWTFRFEFWSFFRSEIDHRSCEYGTYQFQWDYQYRITAMCKLFNLKLRSACLHLHLANNHHPFNIQCSMFISFFSWKCFQWKIYTKSQWRFQSNYSIWITEHFLRYERSPNFFFFFSVSEPSPFHVAFDFII